MYIYIYIYAHIYIYIYRALRPSPRTAARSRACCSSLSLHLGEHKPGRIKPGRIKRAALSLQNQNYHMLCVDTTPFICLSLHQQT